MGSNASGNYGHAGRPGLRGGSGPGAADFKHMTLTHYSREERAKLETKYMGTGYASEELRKGLPFNKHISMYNEKLGKREPFTQGLKRNTVIGKFALLDLNTDIGQKFLHNSQGDLSRLNGSLGRAGWDGYYNTASGKPQIIRLLHDVPTTKAVSVRVGETGFDIQGERMPDRKIGGSSMEHKTLAQHTEFTDPVKVVVSGKNGYRSRTAEDVTAIDLPKEAGGDIVFHRRYPGGRVIPSPYRSKNVTNIKIRTAHSNPERNYAL